MKSKGLDARRAAHRAIVDVLKRGVGSQDALAEVLDAVPDADPRDRALATELVYGTLRWQRRLDHALGAFARRGLPVDDADVVTALRLGAYQLLFLERVAPWAAVDGAVRTVKRLRGPGMAGFVNGVLRALSRRREDPPPLPEGEGDEAIALRHSLPVWVVERLRRALPPDALTPRLVAENQPAPLVVRANRLRVDGDELARLLTAEGATVRRLDDLPDAVVVERPGGILQGASLARGLWLPQDSASQRVVHLLAPEPGERVLDLCAGAGVKTTQLAEGVGPEGHVDAVDLDHVRIDGLRGLTARWGVPGVTARVADATELPNEPDNGYDRVLLDAPCTALGLLRRRPETRWRRTEDDIRERSQLQARLFDAAAAQLRPGGRLVYAVCTFTDEEGPEQVAAFLAAHSDFHLAPARDTGPTAAHIGDDGFLRTSPAVDGGDAFFAAAFIREA